MPVFGYQNLCLSGVEQGYAGQLRYGIFLLCHPYVIPRRKSAVFVPDKNDWKMVEKWWFIPLKYGSTFFYWGCDTKFAPFLEKELMKQIWVEKVFDQEPHLRKASWGLCFTPFLRGKDTSSLAEKVMTTLWKSYILFSPGKSQTFYNGNKVLI